MSDIAKLREAIFLLSEVVIALAAGSGREDSGVMVDAAAQARALANEAEVSR
jgi:hypothetical protein